MRYAIILFSLTTAFWLTYLVATREPASDTGLFLRRGATNCSARKQNGLLVLSEPPKMWVVAARGAKMPTDTDLLHMYGATGNIRKDGVFSIDGFLAEPNLDGARYQVGDTANHVIAKGSSIAFVCLESESWGHSRNLDFVQTLDQMIFSLDAMFAGFISFVGAMSLEALWRKFLHRSKKDAGRAK